MMKHQKRLNLRTQTIHVLSNTRLAIAAGGGRILDPTAYGGTCPPTQMPPCLSDNPYCPWF